LKNNPLLICVVGPTAIGKTTLAIQIAKFFSTEIISADSRQFYKEMSIGTAVPTKEELNTIKHHFIQNRSIFDDYNVGEFERDALLLLGKLFKQNPVIVMVGGSGLYVDAVVKGLDTFPKVSSEIRDQLKSDFESSGIEFLQKELQKNDPEYFKKADIDNHHRVIRALGICRATGLSYSSFLNSEKEPREFETLYIGLTADREIVYDRINRRVDIMMNEGLEIEAKELHQYKSLNAMQTVGYKELFSYFDGVLSKKEAVEEIKKNTRRFAKRQGTWYRKNEAIKWFKIKTSTKEVIEYINNARSN